MSFNFKTIEYKNERTIEWFSYKNKDKLLLSFLLKNIGRS